MFKYIAFLSFLIHLDLSHASETTVELKESTSLIRPNNEVNDFYVNMEFEPFGTYRPINREPEDTWIQIEQPYAGINDLLPDIWQLIMLHVDMTDIMLLALTCRRSHKGYVDSPLNGIIHDKLSISRDFQDLEQKYQPLKTTHGKNIFVFPETSQTFAHCMSLLCQRESCLKNLIKKRLMAYESGQDTTSHLLTKNEKDFLDILNSQWIPVSSIQHVLKDSMKNYPFFSTKIQDDDLTYLAQYSQYPHIITKNRNILRSITLQLSTFMVLAAPHAYGLYRYFVLVPPTGSVLKTMVELKDFIVWGTGDTFSRRYPYVKHRCIGNYHFNGILAYNPDYTFEWYNGNPPYCTTSWASGKKIGNLTECMTLLNPLHLNTTFWTPYLNGGQVNQYDVPCSLNLNDQSITCGTIENWDWDKKLQFTFNTADINCANAYWQTSYTFLAFAGIFGSAALFWEMLEGFHGNSHYSGCAAGVVYVATLIALYVIPSTY